ncbi:hypothetical protein AYI70_g9875 [Smittium culicis]|uniref:Uncharacterized protein n=1 Tax=Smittium culicis TaxID=133412 RepID=A0A1R1X9B9_9FUNG|nr:hypothetical protein AYI70_g9875 [Smittium culicis]
MKSTKVIWNRNAFKVPDFFFKNKASIKIKSYSSKPYTSYLMRENKLNYQTKTKVSKEPFSKNSVTPRQQKMGSIPLRNYEQENELN